MRKQKATNITWHAHKVSREEREKLLDQKGVVLWFTGLSGSGKSTLANEVAYKLHERGKLTYVLDGDNIRHGLNKDLGFTPEDRAENIRRISEVANLFADAGVITLTAFISPYRRDRNFCRSLLKDRFMEIYTKAPLEVCEERDPKGLYKKARAGEIKEFTGIDAPYEPPENPELIIETDKETIEESVNRVIKKMEELGYLHG
ncbi:MAG: adenylyl-sulfate kinase [Thermoplasmata archaeon]|nr:MAG: adenylyl-sulfate kinase [Thermoplasmata archaeon]HEC89871.1 adenylyl-sulfate kinase [Thermoplasmatales archaeon]